MFYLYAISYGFDKDFLDGAIKIKYNLSLIGEYRESSTTSLLYFKTEKTFDELVKLFEDNFSSNGHFTFFTLEKGNYKCINETDKIFKWLWK